MNDIYEIVSRIKNIIAIEDIALSPAGTILVNTYALALKDLYDFAETLPESYKDKLNQLLASKETLPKYVIKVSESKEFKDRLELVLEALAENELDLGRISSADWTIEMARLCAESALNRTQKVLDKLYGEK